MKDTIIVDTFMLFHFYEKYQYLWRNNQNTIFQYGFWTLEGGTVHTREWRVLVCLLVSSSQ